MIIYALIDPIDGRVRYVGKTVRTPQRRLRRHLAAYSLVADTRKDRWLRSLLRLGIEPSIIVLQECSSLEELSRCERNHIAKLRASGAELTNSTDGGDGSGGWKHTLEAREKIRRALSGKPKSPEHRRNSGLAQRGRKASPETRARLSDERRRRGYHPPGRPGSANYTTKLAPTDVDEIRRLRGVMSQQVLANRFSVSKTAIRYVQQGRNWRIRQFPEARS